MDKLKMMHQQDVEYLVEVFEKENHCFEEQAEEAITHLKTVIFGQEEKADNELKKRKEAFDRKHDDLVSSVRFVLAK